MSESSAPTRPSGLMRAASLLQAEEEATAQSAATLSPRPPQSARDALILSARAVSAEESAASGAAPSRRVGGGGGGGGAEEEDDEGASGYEDEFERDEDEAGDGKGKEGRRTTQGARQPRRGGEQAADAAGTAAQGGKRPQPPSKPKAPRIPSPAVPSATSLEKSKRSKSKSKKSSSSSSSKSKASKDDFGPELAPYTSRLWNKQTVGFNKGRSNFAKSGTAQASPLMHLCYAGDAHIDAVEKLLRASSVGKKKKSSSSTSRDSSSSSSDDDSIALSVAQRRAGAREWANEPLETDSGGWSALHYAASRGAGEVLKLLVDRVAKLPARKGDGDGDGEGGEDEEGSRLDGPDELMGWTPLMVAAAELHVECVRVLLEGGADAGKVDIVGDAALDFVPKGKGGRRGREVRSLIKSYLEHASSDEDDEGSASEEETEDEEEEKHEEGKSGSESERFHSDDSRHR